MSQTYMNNIIEQQWCDAIEALAPSKDSKDERESLAMATKVFLSSMDPEKGAAAGAHVSSSLSMLIRRGLGRWAGSWLLETFRKDALERVVPLLDEIECQYKDYISTDTQAHNKSADWVILAFQNVIQEIHERFDLSRQTARLFDERIRDVKKDNPQEIPSLEVLSRFLTEFSAELAIRLPPSFDHVAYLYFETIFQRYEESYPRKPESDCNVDDSDWNNLDEASSGIDQQRKATGYDGDRQNNSNGQQDLRQLGRKRRRVMQDGRFAMDLFVDDMDDELVEQIFHGVHGAASVGSQENDTQMQDYLSLCQMLEDIGFAAHMTDVVTRMFIKEFFDIIVEHPDSTPAVLDLSTCIKWTGQRDQLQNAIVAAVEKRLLHPGAETGDIIEFYISTIKYLRMLDPSGVMLGHAARAISQYLRTRDDTMRAIVSCIVDDSSDLLTNTAEGIQVNADLDNEGSDDDSWVPEPVNAGPDLSSARRRMADIISVLANIYDTNDRFIKEFQAILADRLLQATDFQVDREVRQLELLKLRFGETDLQHCEVMLADVAESKRVNANIQSLNPDVTPLNITNIKSNLNGIDIVALNVSATIASRYYWPEIENEELKLPDVFQHNAFEVSKPAQKLVVFPSLGMVELELEFTNRTLNIQVEPIQAAIIHCFEDLDTWALTDISAKLQVPEETLEQKIQFWVREGVLKEVNRLQYQLVENI
ncbi:Anaphase-promoting complex subunit 2 [Mortierella sp. AD011]|nr:Anaphase-promoting complex subunit 2 [Mortierella sp. AD010]KAF9397170.1 Anaphase-promoting complex subunit 2 [Mortierella sp. AD011]